MFIFLFLSGYGLYCSFLKSGLANYWEKKIHKIYFPAVLAQGVGAVVYVILTRKIPDRTTLFDDIFIRAFQSEFNPFIWYLQYLLIWYILFYAVYKMVNRRAYRAAIWIMLDLLMWYFAGEIFSGLANEYCMAFPLGIAWALIVNEKFEVIDEFKRKIKKKLLIVCVILVLIITACIIVNYNMWTDKNIFWGRNINFWLCTGITNGLYLIICIAISLIFNIIFSQCNRRALLERVGSVSYYIYLLHGPLIVIPLEVIGKYRMIVLLIGIFVMSYMIFVYLRLKMIVLKRMKING